MSLLWFWCHRLDHGVTAPTVSPHPPCPPPPLSPDPGVLCGVLEGHSDAVWGLAFDAAGDVLASCSADGTLRLWDPRGRAPACLRTYDASAGEPRGDAAGDSPGDTPVTLCVPPAEHGVPTSVTFSATHPGRAAVAFRSGATVLYDVEAARPVVTVGGE